MGLEKIAKIQNILKSELNQAKKLQIKSIDELKKIARLRTTKNNEKSTKEDLSIILLKFESSAAEQNFKKLFNNNNTNDDTYDDKIRGKISDINLIFSRLGNIITKSDRKKIKKEFYEIEKKKNLSDKEKEEVYDYLVKSVKTLNKKEKYQYHDRDHLDYYEIKDVENLSSNAADDDDGDHDDYKSILIKSSFKNNYKYYESR